MNVVVLALSWLHLGQPAAPPSAMSLQSPLTRQQWRVVKRLEHLSSNLFNAGKIEPASMGRSAAKVESLASLLGELREAARKLASPYEHRDAQLQSGHQHGHPGQVVGRCKKNTTQLAKCVEPSRLSFPKEAPRFDPTDLLEGVHQQVFQDPISLAIPPEE